MGLTIANDVTLKTVPWVMPAAPSLPTDFTVAAAPVLPGEPSDEVADTDTTADDSAADQDTAQIDSGESPVQVAEAVPDVSAAPVPVKTDPGYVEVEVGKGDTIGGVLESAGIGKDESMQVVAALKKHYDPKDIQVGQKIRVDYDPAGDDGSKFSKISMKLSPFKDLEISKLDDEDGQLVSKMHEKELKQRSYAGHATIENSLYGSAEKAGIPSSVIAEVIRIYSLNTDFQRDIHRGDKIQVLYDVMETEEGVFARTDKVLYANLTINGRDVPIYRYETADGRADYYQPDGHSIRKALMKTPIDGARVSSGFGMREHPVLGYTKMHKGIDFAAPRGTPIYAAGSGTVEYAGRFTSYGNYVRINHNSHIKTAYAHMNGFGPGIHPGVKVTQGQIIGYVGTTGRSTGPHLHYEVIADGRQINPNSMKLPTGDQLAGKDLKNFKAQMAGLQQQYVSTGSDLKFAVNATSKAKASIVR